MNHQAVLSGEAGLAGVQWAIGSRPAHQTLREALRQMLSPGSQIGPLHLTRVKYKPGKRLQAYYNVLITPPDGAPARERPIAAAWKDSPHEAPAAPSQQTLEDEARDSGLLSPFVHLQHDLPELGLRMQVWPFDPDFPQLVRLGNPKHIPRLLAAAGVAWPGVDGGQARITPIRYRPGERHVLRYQLNAPETAPYDNGMLYAKLYQTPQAAARAFRLANRLVDYLAANVQGVYGVQPVGMSSEDAVILYPHAAGIPLSRQLGRAESWRAAQLQRIGTALACLHQSGDSLTEDLSENTLEREMKVIARASEHVQVLLPPAGAQILRLLERAQEINQRLPQEPPTFTHSDFKADHLLISRAGIALIDFDTCALADPALDIGKFLADLEWWHALSGLPGVEQAQQAFVDGYNAQLMQPDPHRLARARLYHALILMKITIRRARLNWPDWERRTSGLIQRAEGILKGVT